MRTTLLSAALIGLLLLVRTGPAQVPAVPGAPALPGGPVPAAPGAAAGAAGAGGAGAAPAAPPAGGNIWSFFMKTPAQKAQIKACFCNSRIGQFINNLMLPAGALTGGILGPICPGPNAPNPADLAKPATSAQGAAAKIKAEEAQAKAKIAAIEYLATVDCRYYPEAEAALIGGLRAEKNECVRLAAAKALASGCCCSARVIKALTICVNCSTKDGFPAEASELVRTYAYVALERCLRKCVEAEPEVPPEPPAAAKKAMYETLQPMGSTPDYTAAILLAGYFSIDSTETMASLIAAARQTLARGLQVSPATLSRLSRPRNVRDAMLPASAKYVTIVPPATTRRINPPEVPAEMPAPGAPVSAEEMGSAERSESMAIAPRQEKRPGRSNVLNILQDAFRR